MGINKELVVNNHVDEVCAALVQQAEEEFKQGRSWAAKAILTKITAKYPDAPLPQNKLANVLLSLGELESALSVAEGMRRKLPPSWWIGPLVEALQGLGRHEEACHVVTEEAEWNNISQDGKAILMLGNALIADEMIDVFLAQHSLDPDTRDLCATMLTRKYKSYVILNRYNYDIVSLGSQCHVATMKRRWYLGNFPTEYSDKLPFDLALHPTDAVLYLLETSFKGYSDNISSELFTPKLANTPNFFSFKSREWGIIFNHDKASRYGFNPTVFSQVLKERVSKFYDTINTKKVLFIHIVKDISREDIERFSVFIEMLPQDSPLLIVVQGKENRLDQRGNLYILTVSCPIIGAENILSAEYLEFETQVIDAICTIIPAHFPQKAEKEQMTLDAANTVNVRARTLEVAAEYDVKRYVEEIKKSVGVPDPDQSVGAIVMNCNPFTNGHRYLVERAAASVDKLILFVVEEDRSDFTFADRLSLVSQGIADIANVVVVRSGKFIISTVTFPLYFEKYNPDMTRFDAALDLDFFCLYIAPALGITVRFVGTEPNCRVTEEYNRQMALKLPEHGIRLDVIERLERGGKPISASEVRQLWAAGEKAAVRGLVPDVTYEYLINATQHQKMPGPRHKVETRFT